MSPGAGDELVAVVHADREAPAHVVLEVGREATLGVGDRLHVVGPAPPRLEDETPDFTATDLDDLRPAVRKLAYLVGSSRNCDAPSVALRAPLVMLPCMT